MHGAQSRVRNAICNLPSASTKVGSVKRFSLAAILIPFAVVSCAADRSSAPGFWERLWGSTKHAGGSAVNAVKAPFKKREREPAGTADWQSLSMTVKLDPAVVKLPDVRAVDVTVAVANKGKRAVQLDFPTSQRIEVLVKD